MRYLTLFILIFVFACSKKSGGESSQNPPDESPQNPPFSNYDILNYLGFSVGKQHKYYEIDTMKIAVTPAYPETTSINQDTILRVISDTFGNLNVIYYDSAYSSGQKTYDTLYVYNPFVIDTIRGTAFLFMKQINFAIANKIFKAPLSLNESWTPIESQYIVLSDTFKAVVVDPCSLWIYFDTLKIDSSIKKVIELSNDSTFKLFSKYNSRILYRYQTKPLSAFCNDTTIKKDTLYLFSMDTTYLKPYLGIQRIIGFDSTSTDFTIGSIIGPISVNAYTKTYRKRFRVGP